MVNIWKIGAWPGIGSSNTPKNKQRFISIARKNGFVALGSAYVDGPIGDFSDEKLGEKIEKKLEEKDEEPTYEKVKNRKDALRNFANVKEGDIILLYNRYKVYVGLAETGSGEGKDQEKPYYHVEEPYPIPNGYTDGKNIAPHRVAIDWQFEGKSFAADFSKGRYRSRFIPIKEEDIKKTIKSDELKEYLKRKLRE